MMKACSDAGLIVLMAGPDVIRIAPSLIISLDEILKGSRASKSRWASHSPEASVRRL